jgi:hypothetical protein
MTSRDEPPFVREPRYVVLKLKDFDAAGVTPAERKAFNAVCDKINSYRIGAGKGLLYCVVIESNWKCYEQAWGLVKAEWESRQ